MQIVFTPEASHLDHDIDTADRLEKHPNNESHSFNDGEAYMRYQLGKDTERVLLVHSGFPNPNKGMKRVYSFLELCRNKGVRVQLFFTYFPFQRQDQKFRDGEVNEVEHIINKLRDYYQVEQIYTVDPHFDALEYEISEFNPVDEGVLETLIMQDNVFLLGADNSAGDRYDIPSVDKARKSEDKVNVSAHKHKENIEDSHIILIDDMISSGGTMRSCVEEVADYAPERISTYSTHILDDRADAMNISKIKLLSSNFVSSNSIKTNYRSADIVYDVREKIMDIASEVE